MPQPIFGSMGLSEEKPSAFKFMGAVRILVDYRCLISSRGGFDYLTAYHFFCTAECGHLL